MYKYPSDGEISELGVPDQYNLPALQAVCADERSVQHGCSLAILAGPDAGSLWSSEKPLWGVQRCGCTTTVTEASRRDFPHHLERSTGVTLWHPATPAKHHPSTKRHD